MRLHLTLKKRWFDMIISGEKTEEYRDIKMYWATRLQTGFPSTFGIDTTNPDWKNIDEIEFRNGYKKDSPSMLVECLGISIGISKMEWCDGEEKRCFVLKLGKIISSKI